MKFLPNPVVVEATQWLKNGDHPNDRCVPVTYDGETFMSEGKAVRYYRHPNVCRH
jgi:hypothetical protein